MTRDEAIEIALRIVETCDAYHPGKAVNGFVTDALLDAYERGRRDGREECEKIARDRADEHKRWFNNAQNSGSPLRGDAYSKSREARDIADAIRARGEP